jgi:hypothetical protein
MLARSFRTQHNIRNKWIFNELSNYFSIKLQWNYDLLLHMHKIAYIFLFFNFLHSRSTPPLFILVDVFNAPHTKLIQNFKIFFILLCLNNLGIISQLFLMLIVCLNTLSRKILHFFLSSLSFQILSISCKFC